MSSKNFLANSPSEAQAMLAELDLSDFDALFADIPAALQTDAFQLPAGLSEMAMLQRLERLADRNATSLINFCGGGFYDHFIPAAVDALAGRAEFYTAYTPYQPEAAQGTLQAIYEYQTAIARLTGMEIANASLYDGGTAIFEAIMMAFRITRRRRVLVDAGLNPIYRAMLRSYFTNLDFELSELPLKNGLADHAAFQARCDDQLAAIVLQNPNFLGCLDDYAALINAAHQAGALGIVSSYPLALGLLKPPGDSGADIVVGEGQSLGLPLAFGGPYLGFLATRKQYVHKMPGRLVGATRDARGRRGFVLTLQAREQHIRREKATSNICTNEAHCALRALIYLSLLGKAGLLETAELCAANAAYGWQRLTAIPRVQATFPHPFFNEFAISLPTAATTVIDALFAQGFAAGIPLARYGAGTDNSLLIAFTEKRTKEDIDRFAEALAAAIQP